MIRVNPHEVSSVVVALRNLVWDRSCSDFLFTILLVLAESMFPLSSFSVYASILLFSSKWTNKPRQINFLLAKSGSFAPLILKL